MLLDLEDVNIDSKTTQKQATLDDNGFDQYKSKISNLIHTCERSIYYTDEELAQIKSSSQQSLVI